MFNQTDQKIMEEVLEEARRTLAKGNYPVGAALVVDGQILDLAHNLKNTNADHISHAEVQLFQRFSRNLYKLNSDGKPKIEIYTSLEPCLMCYGMSINHRVSRIVYTCPDPTQPNIKKIFEQSAGAFYITHPKVEQIQNQQLFEQSRDLFVEYLQAHPDPIYQNNLKLFQELRYVLI